MKIIPSQKIINVVATSANANYPASNVIDEHPKKLWKASAGVSLAVLFLEIKGGTGGLALFNTNALSIEATIVDPNAVSWEAGVSWETGVEWVSIGTVLVESYELDGVSGAAWIEWEHTGITLIAALVLTGVVGETLQMGVAVSDAVYEYKNPSYGVKEGMHSYSIIRELQNGALYRNERDKVRTFGFSMTEDRAEDFYEFMYSVARELGYKPAAWQLADTDGFWWVIYANLNGMPSGNHSMFNHTKVNVKLMEVL